MQIIFIVFMFISPFVLLISAFSIISIPRHVSLTLTIHMFLYVRYCIDDIIIYIKYRLALEAKKSILQGKEFFIKDKIRKIILIVNLIFMSLLSIFLGFSIFLKIAKYEDPTFAISL